MMSMREALMFNFSYLKKNVGKCRKIKLSFFNALRFLVYLNLLANIMGVLTKDMSFIYIQAYSAPLLIVSIIVALVASKICPEPKEKE